MALAYVPRPLVARRAATMGNIFDDVGDVVSKAAGVVAHAGEMIFDAGRASVDPVYGIDLVRNDVAPFLGDAIVAMGKGAKAALALVKTITPYLQLGLSCFPGIGTGISAALGCAVALADGRGITQALLDGAKGALPGGPVVADVFETAVNAVGDMADGESIGDAVAHASLDEIRSEAVRNFGDAGGVAFDTGLALAHGKRLQDAALDAGLAAARGYLPNTPAAKAAMVVTADALRGKPSVATLTGAAAELIPLVPGVGDLYATADDAYSKARQLAEAAGAVKDVLLMITSGTATASLNARINAMKLNPVAVAPIVQARTATTATRIAAFEQNPVSVAAIVASRTRAVATVAPAPPRSLLSRVPTWLGVTLAAIGGLGAAYALTER